MNGFHATNGDVAEHLAACADEHPRGTNKSKALRRASRWALLWKEEARDVVARGESLTILPGVGPYVAAVIASRPCDSRPPPPVRRGFLTATEVAATISGHPLPSQVLGDCQSHSTWSDGSATLTEMRDAARNRRYRWLIATDHTKGLAIAHGMDEARAREQQRAIDALSDTNDCRMIKGLEMNLLPSGEGDMDPVFLGSVDVVLGAFHSKLRLTDDQTARYIAALRNPHINVLAHPRGRIYNFREGLHADWPTVFEEAARRGVAMEIDGYPDRQDLDTELLGVAAQTGVYISLGSDAHAPDQLRFLDFSVAAAIRAGIHPDRIINTMSGENLIAWARDRRPSRAGPR